MATKPTEVTTEQIAIWKETYGYVFKTNISGHDLYFRTVTRDDYIDVMQESAVEEKADPERITVEKCLLNAVPEDLLFKKGGIATVLYEQIMLKSGFQQIECEEL